MIPRGGIDSQIDQRKAQFGANPQALQQRYGQSKDLLDLLALQQIAKEQEQKSQMMALQMQQNPATIANQLEQEVLQGKKADMAQSLRGMQAMRAPKRSQSETARGVAGALAQKQRQQQANMQKVARSGVAGQRARNMERMYDGGIVGFNDGGYNPTEEEIDAAIEKGIREGTLLRSTPRSKVRAMLKREKDLSQTRETVGDIFTGIGRRAMSQSRRGRPPEEEESARVQEAETLGTMPVRQRAPDPMGGGTVSDLLTAEPLEDDSYVQPTPEKVEQTAPQVEQTAPRESVDEAIAAAVGGIDTSDLGNIPPQISAGTSPTFDTGSGEFQSFLEEAAGGYAPNREPPPQEDRLSGIFGQLKSSMEQEAEDIKRAREALETKYGGRSKGKKFLDRFIRAAQLQNQGRMRTSNRDALAGFLGGFATATGEEREAQEKGLAELAERQGKLTERQLGIATGIAGIKRGEAQTEQGARGLDLEARRIGVEQERIATTAKLAADELAFKRSKLDKDDEKAVRIANIAAEGNEIQREFNNARTAQAKQNLLAKYEELIFDYDDAINEALADEIEAIRMLPGVSEAEKQTEMEAARKRAAEVKRKRRGMLRAMQELATGINVDSLRPTVGESVDTEGFEIKSVR